MLIAAATRRLAAALLVGGLLSVERKSVGQFMLSRPLVAATAVYVILCGWHGWMDSMLMGIVLELYFLVSAPYGVSTPPNDTLAAVFAGALVARLPFWWPPDVTVPVGLALAIPVAALGQYTEAAWEKWNIRLANRMDAELTAGRTFQAMQLPWLSIIAPFVAGVIATGLGAVLNRPVLLFIHPKRTDFAGRWIEFALPMVLGVLAGLLLRTGRTRRSMLVAGVTLLLFVVIIGSSSSGAPFDFFMY